MIAPPAAPMIIKMSHQKHFDQVPIRICGPILIFVAILVVMLTLLPFGLKTSALENDRLSGGQIFETKHIQAADGHLEGQGQKKEGATHVWSYANQNSWDGQCKGENMRQSPIDIKTDDVTFASRLKLEFIDYDQEVEFELKNTHHSVSLKPIPAISTPIVRINWLSPDSSEFELKEIHFHWGNGLDKGSEHEINDQKAAAEMHMVHYRKGIKAEDIGNTENSVVVICVLIESDIHMSHRLDSLVKKAERINGTDLEYIDDNPENLIDMLPENHHTFYTYNGSLTTPPCYEVVTWIILSEPVYMAQDKLVELSNLEAICPENGRRKIAANNRDIQPLLNRPVYASFNASEITSDKLAESSRYFNGQNFRKAFTEYWHIVSNLQSSVKRSLEAIKLARQRLRENLKSLAAREASGGGGGSGSNSTTAGSGD